MILIKINKSLKTPLYKQIVEQFIELINKEVLKPGDHLPSTRKLAQQYKLNRNTIYKAYEELWALGYIESTSGSYSKVRDRLKMTATEPKDNDQSIHWQNHIKNNVLTLHHRKNEVNGDEPLNNAIDFRKLSPDPRVLPNDEYRKCVNEVMRSENANLLLYGEPEGLSSLRESLAQHMQLHSIKVDHSEIIITNGAQNALDLIAQLFIEPGDTILIEKPTYSAAIPIFKYHHANIIEVSIKKDGLALDELEQVLQRHNPKFLYTMPNFQNPTGITSGQEHREKLLELAERYELPIIEDGFAEEMKYLGKSILPIKSMDKKGLIFYIGTFSKVLFPGIRIGWIASNEYCTERFAEIKKTTEISMNNITQAGLELFCKKGLYEKQLKRIHSIYKKRMYIALKTLRENLINPKIEYTKPIGGYTIWFELDKDIISEKKLIEILRANGVLVTPGSNSFYTKSNNTNFRISIAHRDEEEIKRGIIQITQILNQL